MTLLQLNCLIEHLVKNNRHKTFIDKELIKFYKDKRKELIKQINTNIKTELFKPFKPLQMQKTKVVYKILNDEVIAIFPNELYNETLYGKTLVNSYMHMGQHSHCSVELINELKNATKEQYKDLKIELEEIGYNLI